MLHLFPHSALSTSDESRNLSRLIGEFVQRVDYGEDFESRLEFYGAARAAFHALEAVTVTLVQVGVNLSGWVGRFGIFQLSLNIGNDELFLSIVAFNMG